MGTVLPRGTITPSGTIPPSTADERAVPILLECFLVDSRVFVEESLFRRNDVRDANPPNK